MKKVPHGVGQKKEELWHFNKVVVVASVDVPGKCLKRPARIARKNAKFHSSPAVIVPSIAKTASPSARKAAAKKLAVLLNSQL